jgi:hypothetical protein
MPSRSKAQARLFQAACHDEEVAKRLGVSQAKAKEWCKEDERRGNLGKGSKLPARKKKGS